MMTTAATQIMNRLADVFAPLDAEVLTATQEWAKERVAAIAVFKASDEYTAIRHDPWKLYDRLHDIAGGKTWFAVFNGNSKQRIEEFVEKNCATTADKRNARIAAKLKKAGVVEVVSEDVSRTSDGFNGLFAVNTDIGAKCVSVRTIVAGGFNIQCLHLRVLVDVR